MGFSYSAESAFSRTKNDETAFRRQFWRKVQGAAASVPFAEDLLAAYYCAFDKTTPTSVKASLLGALAYFVLPTDAVPDFLPVLGFTDDAAILAAAIKMVADHIRPEHRDAARRVIASLD
jgi:uncharacterized membrane protein YkvA (DUF1232 family)